LLKGIEGGRRGVFENLEGAAYFAIQKWEAGNLEEDQESSSTTSKRAGYM